MSGPNESHGISSLAAVVALATIGLVIVALISIFGHGDNSALITLIITSGVTVITAILGLLRVSKNEPPGNEADKSDQDDRNDGSKKRKD